MVVVGVLVGGGWWRWGGVGGGGVCIAVSAIRAPVYSIVIVIGVSVVLVVGDDDFSGGDIGGEV